MIRVIRWSPIEFELDENYNLRCNVKETCFAILKDIEDKKEETIKYQKSLEKEYNVLLPFLDMYCNKYILNDRKDIGFVFEPRLLKGTFVVDNIKSFVK